MSVTQELRDKFGICRTHGDNVPFFKNGLSVSELNGELSFPVLAATETLTIGRAAVLSESGQGGLGLTDATNEMELVGEYLLAFGQDGAGTYTPNNTFTVPKTCIALIEVIPETAWNSATSAILTVNDQTADLKTLAAPKLFAIIGSPTELSIVLVVVGATSAGLTGVRIRIHRNYEVVAVTA